MKRLIFTICILAMAASSAPGEAVRFAILGDRSGGVNQEKFEEVVRDIARMRPDFVITVGDIPDDAEEEDWLVSLKTLETISAPIYFTPGNNDIVDAESAARYTKHTGFTPYYSFNIEDIHFIILDNSIAESIHEMGEEQLQWLEKDLKKHRRADLTIVFMHKPFWASGIAEGNPDPLHEMFKTWGVDAVFTGHWHQYAHDRFDGIDYYLVGSSGGGFPFIDESLGMFYQYMWCTVEEEEFYPVLMKAGHTTDLDIMNISEEQAVYSLQSDRFITASCTEDGYASLTVTNINDYPLYIDPILSSETAGGLPVIPDIAIEPKKTWSFNFRFTPGEDILDTPYLSFIYTFGRNKTYMFNKPLALIRKFAKPGADREPVIDGEHTTGEWEDFTAAVQFYSHGEETGLPTELRLGKDSRSIYGTLIMDDMAEREQLHMTPDSEVYNDPSAGFVFTTDGLTYYQFYINEAGVIWDAKADTAAGVLDAEWDSAMACAASKSDGQSILDFRIPLADLDALNGEEVFVNFRRRQDKDDIYLTLPWNYSFKTFAVIK